MSDRRNLATCLLVLATLLLAACRESAPSKDALPVEYLGRWYLSGTSGGIQGREVATADGSSIVITADGTLERYSAEGGLESSEACEPTRGRSIFTGEDAWILGGPDAVERVIQLHPDGNLTISDNVYDGFGSTYTRDP